MSQVTFKHGNIQTIDHTPGSAVSAGDVVLQGHVPMVAPVDIAASAKGSLSAKGGVYVCTPDAAIAIGQPVWWDDTANEITETAAGNEHFGFTVSASYETDAKVDVLHAPQGVTGLIV